MESSSKVAVLGCGRMGGAMAATLGRAGFDLILWSRDPQKAEALAGSLGAMAAVSPAEAVEKAEVVLSSLADDAAVRNVYLGDQGVVFGVGPGVVVLETSTISPEIVNEVGAAVDERGAHFYDSPVSGSVATVEQGALTIMVGGDVSHLQPARQVLEALSSRVVETGPRGSGSATKLAVNAIIHGLNQALSEALVLAESAGVAREIAYEVFATGAAGAPFVQYKRAAYEQPEHAVVAFSLDLVAKDLELITALGRQVGVPMGQAEVNLSIVERAIGAGLGDHDLSALAVLLREETGVQRAKGDADD